MKNKTSYFKRTILSVFKYLSEISSLSLKKLSLFVIYLLNLLIGIKSYVESEYFEIKKNIKIAAKNNYVLGKMMLRKNNIHDAKIRFILANIFHKNSARINYQLAYVYFIEGKYLKSLKYLHIAIKINPNIPGAMQLLHKVESILKL